MNGWRREGGDPPLAPVIGVLALQGDFREHAAALRSLGVRVREVRLPQDLDGLDGLILPGGESTTIARLLTAFDLDDPIRRRGGRDFAIWGTCAGAILLADDVPALDRAPLGLLPMTVDRNAYGRQVDSFETDLRGPALGPAPFHAVFIRAPRIRRVGKGVQVVLTLNGEPVMVRRERLLATTFHPELTADPRLHQYFLDQCVGTPRPAAAARADVLQDAGIT